MKKATITKTQLPPLKKDHVRVVHLTPNPNQREFIQKGLLYSGSLSSTARAWTNENEVEYTSKDSRFRNAHAAVFDVPAEEYRLHEDVARAPGVLLGKYFVGMIKKKKR